MEISKKTFFRIFGGVILCILVYWLLHETERFNSVFKAIKGIVSPFVVGAALAFILNVPMRAIENRLKFIKIAGVRRSIAILLTFVAILLVLTLVIVLLVPQIDATVRSLAAELPGFFRRTQQMVESFLTDHPQIMHWLQDYTDLEKLDWASVVQKAASITANSITAILNSTISAVGSVVTGVMNAVIALVFSLYCLGRKEVLARQGRRLLYAFLPERVCDEIIRIFRLTNSTFSNFISGQCLEALILGVMFAIAMPIFGMPYVPLVSVLVAVTALVPLVGAFFGCGLGALFILVDSPLLALWFLVLFLVLQQIEGNLIYPRVVGTSIGLPGMWVLVAVAVGGGSMGIGGMLLMIPLASVLYALLREFTSHRIAQRNIPSDKLMDQPPEFRSKRKARQQKSKKLTTKKNADKQQK